MKNFKKKISLLKPVKGPGTPGNPIQETLFQELLRRAGPDDINREIQFKKYGWIGNTLRKKNEMNTVTAGTETQFNLLLD